MDWYSGCIEGAANVSSKAGTQIASFPLMCNVQAEDKLFMGLPYRFHALAVNAALSFESQTEPLVRMEARLERGLVYIDSLV